MVANVIDPMFLKQLFYLVVAILIGYVVARVIGVLTNRAVDRTIEKWVDKTSLGKSLRSLEIDLSDTVGLFLSLFIFLLFLSWGVSQVTLAHPWWVSLVNLVNYSITVVLGFAFITVALVFAVFLGDYFGKLSSGYREDVAELLKLFLVIGLIWVVVRAALNMMQLGGAMISDLINGFVAFALGWVLADTIIDKLVREYKHFESFAPFGKFVIFLIFILVGLNAVFAEYLSTSILQVLAWGVVFLFVAAAVPLVVKAIKE